MPGRYVCPECQIDHNVEGPVEDDCLKGGGQDNIDQRVLPGVKAARLGVKRQPGVAA